MMRKISTKEKEAKKQRRNQIILGMVLVGVMLFSVLGYAFRRGDKEEDNQKMNYNGFEFFQEQGRWYTEIDGVYFTFENNPGETGNVTTEGELKKLSEYKDKPLYIDSDNSGASFEISYNLQDIAERIQSACINEQDCEGNFPVKTCKDNIIIIKEAEKGRILQNESCVFIYGDKENMTKTADYFLFKILDIK